MGLFSICQDGVPLMWAQYQSATELAVADKDVPMVRLLATSSYPVEIAREVFLAAATTEDDAITLRHLNYLLAACRDKFVLPLFCSRSKKPLERPEKEKAEEAESAAVRMAAHQVVAIMDKMPHDLRRLDAVRKRMIEVVVEAWMATRSDGEAETFWSFLYCAYDHSVLSGTMEALLREARIPPLRLLQAMEFTRAHGEWDDGRHAGLERFLQTAWARTLPFGDAVRFARMRFDADCHVPQHEWPEAWERLMQDVESFTRTRVQSMAPAVSLAQEINPEAPGARMIAFVSCHAVPCDVEEDDRTVRVQVHGAPDQELDKDEFLNVLKAVREKAVAWRERQAVPPTALPKVEVLLMMLDNNNQLTRSETLFLQD